IIASPKCYAEAMSMELMCRQRNQLVWRRTPSSVSRRRNRAPRAKTWNCSLILAILLFLFTSVPSADLPWTIHSQPTRLLNGAPVLFQIKAPTKLDSLTGTWLGHDLTFSYNVSAKTWFALAGVDIERTPGKYPLELTGQSATSKAPLKFTYTFAIARAQYPKIRVNLAVEK